MSMSIAKKKENMKNKEKSKAHPNVIKLERPSDDFSKIEEVLTMLSTHESQENEKCSRILEDAITKVEQQAQLCSKTQKALDEKRKSLKSKIQNIYGTEIAFPNTTELLIKTMKMAFPDNY